MLVFIYNLHLFIALAYNAMHSLAQVCHFPVLHFPALHFRPTFFALAFSAPPNVGALLNLLLKLQAYKKLNCFHLLCYGYCSVSVCFRVM